MLLDHILPLFVIITVLLLGLINLLQDYRIIKEKKDFVEEFLSKYSLFIESYKKQKPNQEIYYWLTQKTIKIQNILGPYGKAALYRPAFAGYAIKDYELIVNLLPQIARGNAHQDELMTISETLVKYLGVIEEECKEQKKKTINPLVWFREGISIIILLPFYFLRFLGLSISNTIHWISNSLIVKVVSGVIAIITLVGGVFSIIAGWDSTMKIISNWFVK